MHKRLNVTAIDLGNLTFKRTVSFDLRLSSSINLVYKDGAFIFQTKEVQFFMATVCFWCCFSERDEEL